MGKSAAWSAVEAKQARVAKGVWGLLFLVLGALFMLDEAGEIDMRGPGKFPAEFAVDGDPRTRWSSGWSDPQSITVDLGEVVEISRVRLVWESAYARAYRIETSVDGTSFAAVREMEDSDGEVDDLEVQASGRYLRMTGTKRASNYGYSLWELEAYGPRGIVTPGKPVRATSTESLPLWPLYWSRYWPLLLIALGLPALIVPKDGGDQFLGLVFMATGTFFQLQRLGMVRWTFAQAWPILLVVGGAMLVVQALRQPGVGSAGSGPTLDGQIGPTASGG